MNKKTFAAFLAATMLLLNFAPTIVLAAANSPYCRISYDSSVGCNTVKYYYYIGDSARYDATRLVKYYDGKILLGTSNTIITSNHKQGTNPAWTTDGKYLIWNKSDSSLWAREYDGKENIKLIDGVSSLGLNAESMVETVSFSDNSSRYINELLPTKVSSTSTPTPTATTCSTVTAKPTSTPAVNKTNYCKNYSNKSVFYPAGSSNKYVFKRKGTKLYLNEKLAVTNIKKAKNQFGFNKSTHIIFVKNHKVYLASKFDPTNHILIKQNVKSLKFDKKTGFVTSVNRLKQKLDYVKSSKFKAVLYQNGKKANVLKTNKSRTKLYLDGKLVAKSQVKFTKLGFTEKGDFCYCKKSKAYTAKITSPNSKKKWTNANKLSKTYLGFTFEK